LTVRITRHALTALTTLCLLGTAAPEIVAQSPAADSGAVEPTFVTVRFIPSDSVRTATLRTKDGVTQEVGNCWAPMVVDASDPRLAGDLTYCSDWHWFGPMEASPSVGSVTYRLVTDEGAWQGSTMLAGWLDPESGDPMAPGGDGVILAGEGAYEGLYAALTFLPDWSDIRGLIFDGAPPAAPVPPPAE
jgi:hypothetical protein